MKYFNLVLTSLLISLALESPANESAVNAYPVNLSGEGVSAEMVTFQAKYDGNLSDALIKFFGPAAFAEGIDQQVQRYTAVKSDGSILYFSLRDGKRRLKLDEDGRYQVFLDKKTVPLRADPKLNKNIKSDKLYQDYLSSIK